jgi:hypothetical protein
MANEPWNEVAYRYFVAALAAISGTGTASQQIQGNAASGATDAGNPVKVGGVYNSTRPTLTNGQRGDLQVGTRGSLNVSLFNEDTTASPAIAQASADDVAATVIGLTTRAFGYAFDGTTWDRRRSVTTAPTGTAASDQPLWTTSDLTRVRVNTAVAGDNTIVAAVSGQTTRIHRMKLSVAGPVIVQVKDGAGTILEVFNFAGNGGGLVLDFASRPWYITTANTAFILNLSAAVQVDGRVEYVTSA